ncbi:putative quinol monooxygenase [Nocardia sp. NPDC050712]|uniref:putative quinol monooxygenase n=1 Tax=Nocardia sp. NPDC050712 TaxID=3155518 RepID=UPI003402A561
MYQIVVSFTVDSGKRDAFRDAALRAHTTAVENEPGTKRFDIVVDEWNPSRFYINEGYADQAAFQAHVDAASTKEFLAEVQQYCSGPDFLVRGNSLH